MCYPRWTPRGPWDVWNSTLVDCATLASLAVNISLYFIIFGTIYRQCVLKFHLPTTNTCFAMRPLLNPYTNNIFPNIFSDLSVSHLVYNFYFFTNNWRFPIFICGLKQRVIITRWALTLFDRTYWHETAIQRINFSKYSLSNVSRMGINSSATYSLTWTKDSSRSQDSIIWKKSILCNPNNSSAITPEERRV